MILKPFTDATKDEDAAIAAALVEAGIISPPAEEGSSQIKNIQDVFNRQGASLEDAAKQISNVMRRGESDNSILKASELVLKVHGALQELESTHSTPEIHINVIGSENKTLINLVLPKG